MRFRRSERGEGNIGCILWLLVLVLAVMVAWKAVPVKLNSSKFYGYLDEVAKFQAARSQTDDMKKSILNRAKDLDIAVDPNNVIVIRKGDFISIDVTYVVPVELLGFTYQWKFHHRLDRQIFIV